MNAIEKALAQKVIGDIDRIADALEKLVVLMSPPEEELTQTDDEEQY
jgi:hypothetical protein